MELQIINPIIQNNDMIELDGNCERQRADSDSNIILNKTQTSETCLISYFDNSKQNKVAKYEMIIEFKNKLISIFFHVFLMSIFEILFYFYFVIEIEKELFLKKITSYNKHFESLYNENVDNTQHYVLKNFIKEMFNSNTLETLQNRYENDLKEQKILRMLLIKKAIIISCIFGIIFLCSLIFGKKEIKVRWVLFENIFLFLFLGIYEYIFFNLIILKYNPITDAEIQYLFLCDFLSNFDMTC
jgi:hypothetical protein